MSSLENTFDVEQFAAELKLGFLPTERLPAVAQDALQAGFKGPAVVRLAVLLPSELSEIASATSAVLRELGCREISVADAVLMLAERRARRILLTSEDALLSAGYFFDLYHRLPRSIGSEAVPGLDALAYLDEVFYGLGEDRAAFNARAKEILEEFTDEERRIRGAEERRTYWEAVKARLG